MSLDEAREEAAGLLRQLIHREAHVFSVPAPDLARQYVTAQANYTNMLRDWEDRDDD